MTTEQTMTDAPSTPPPAAPAPQPAAPTITPEVQALIEAAKSSAYNAGAKDARIALEAKFKSPPSAPPAAVTPPAAPSPVDALAILKLRDDFDDATADLGLPSVQKKFLREQVMATRPPDVSAFVRSFVDVWGPKPAAPTASTVTINQPVTTPATPNAPPVVSRPAAPAPQPVADDAPILSMTPDQRIELERRIGNKAFTDRLMRELPNTRIA
jgi:hypothetical protein